MADQQEFCLRWNDFHSNFHLSLDALRGDESFTDVTLSCSGRLMKAHRVILSACSVHFKELLRGIPPQQHPVIVLPTVDFEVMQAILEFIYQGQVNVRQAQLGAFLQVAETFSIQGLADDDTKKSSQKAAGRVRPPDPEPPAAKRRRSEPPRPPSPPAKSTPSGPAAAAAEPAADHHPAAAAATAARAEDDPEKTVNISVSIKAEGMADTMVGELLEHSEGGEMLDTDMEGAGSDVVAQAMATIGHESADTSATLPPLFGSRRRSKVWLYYDLVEKEAGADHRHRTAVCKLCGKMSLSQGGSTGNLRKHLKSSHAVDEKDIAGLM